MKKVSLSMKALLAVAAGSLLGSGCGGAAASDGSAPAQVGQAMRTSALPQLATGRFHNLALKADGSVWAWGYNKDSQLGDGTTTNRYQPVQVQGLTGTFQSVAAGHNHSMALRSDNTLWAWGQNTSGQLGASGSGATPVQVQNLSNVVAMAGGASFSLGLDGNGDVWAWGSNTSCQSGIGSSISGSSSIPVRVQTSDPGVPYLDKVVAIAAGSDFALAVRDNSGTREVWAWGSNSVGQIGDGITTTTNRCKATKVTWLVDPLNLSAVPVDVAAGHDHSLLLLSNGRMQSWGGNGNGQLGNGTTTQAWSPVWVSSLSGVTQIDGGTYTSLATTSGGTFYAWGHHWYGQLCTGTGGGSSASQSTVPVSPSSTAFPQYNHVGAGEYFSVAMGIDGTLWSCGFEGYGALGYDVPNGSWTNTLTQVPSFP